MSINSRFWSSIAVSSVIIFFVLLGVRIKLASDPPPPAPQVQGPVATHEPPTSSPWSSLPTAATAVAAMHERQSATTPTTTYEYHTTTSSGHVPFDGHAWSAHAPAEYHAASTTANSSYEYRNGQQPANVPYGQQSAPYGTSATPVAVSIDQLPPANVPLPGAAPVAQPGSLAPNGTQQPNGMAQGYGPGGRNSGSQAYQPYGTSPANTTPQNTTTPSGAAQQYGTTQPYSATQPSATAPYSASTTNPTQQLPGAYAPPQYTPPGGFAPAAQPAAPTNVASVPIPVPVATGVSMSPPVIVNAGDPQATPPMISPITSPIEQPTAQTQLPQTVAPTQQPAAGPYQSNSPLQTTPVSSQQTFNQAQPQQPATGAQATPDTITIASFNIQVFGDAKSSKPEVMDILAKVARRFDVIAIQEIRAKDDDIVPNFLRLINAQGAAYDAVVGPRLGRSSSKEQYAIIYNTARIELTQGSVYTVPDPNDRLQREPLVANFRVRGPPTGQGFTFSLADIHTTPEQVTTEIDALADVYVGVQRNGAGEDDIILLGDFNADEYHWGRLGQLPNIGHAITGVTTNTRQSQQYDNLIFDRSATREFLGQAGVMNLMTEYNLTLADALAVSDHFPVFGVFSAYESPPAGPLATRPTNAQ